MDASPLAATLQQRQYTLNVLTDLKAIQGVVESVQQGLDTGFGFVSHIRDSEGLALDFSVASVDCEAVVCNDSLNPPGLVEIVGSDKTRE